MNMARSTAPKPTPQWPDISKPDTRGGGGGTQNGGRGLKEKHVSVRIRAARPQSPA
jgi:hypothetical protein